MMFTQISKIRKWMPKYLNFVIVGVVCNGASAARDSYLANI